MPAPPAPPAGDQKYGKAASDIFKLLVKEEPPDYWKSAHAFDTILDFLNYCSLSKESDAGCAAKWLIAHKASSPDCIWFDDFGWWTIATTRARTFSSIPQDLRKQLGDIADWCWKNFTTNAPYVYERRYQEPTKKPPEDDPYKNCGPAIPGGVWNSYWLNTAPKPEWPGPRKGDPTADTYQGIQNTVTNAVYFLSAKARQDPAAVGEWKFLSSWLTLSPPHAPAPPLWWSIDDKSGLVRERVSHYMNQPDTTPGFQEEWAWTGDQGLILQALVLEAGSASNDPYIARAEQLLTGVRLNLFNKDVLMPWKGNSPTGYENDYQTGIGVFWRSALRVWELGKMHDSLNLYKPLLQKAADAATKPQQDWIGLVNDLAVLVAAYVMLPQMKE